jgi:regulatory protein
MNSLARREYSVLELRTKLQTKGCDEKLAAATVKQLMKDGLVSDSRFAEGMVRYRRNRGLGPVRITLELQEKGVSEAIIEQWMDRKHPHWLAAAEHVREKKFGSSYPDSYDERVRQAKFLQYRGFSFDQIDHALSYPE